MVGYPFVATARAGSAPTAFGGADIANKTLTSMLARVANSLAEHGPGTCEEVTERMALPGERLLLTSVRARVCQLHKQGKVVDSGTRGLGESLRAKVVRWRLATPEEFAAFHTAKKAEAQQ